VVNRQIRVGPPVCWGAGLPGVVIVNARAVVS